MADLTKFKDQETIHYRMGPNGELYAISPDEVCYKAGQAIISRVDADNNTIYFSPPKGVKRG